MVQVKVGTRAVLGEPVADPGAKVETAGLQLVTTDVEEVVAELVRKLGIDLFNDLVGLGVHNVKLARVRLDGGVQWPVVVGPPTVFAGDNVLINLLPTGGGVTRHVNLGDYANTPSTGVGNDVGDILLGVDFASRIGILSNLRVDV